MSRAPPRHRQAGIWDVSWISSRLPSGVPSGHSTYLEVTCRANSPRRTSSHIARLNPSQSSCLSLPCLCAPKKSPAIPGSIPFSGQGTRRLPFHCRSNNPLLSPLVKQSGPGRASRRTCRRLARSALPGQRQSTPRCGRAARLKFVDRAPPERWQGYASAKSHLRRERRDIRRRRLRRPHRCAEFRSAKFLQRAPPSGRRLSTWHNFYPLIVEDQFELLTVEANFCIKALLRFLRVESPKMALRCCSFKRRRKDFGVIIRCHFPIEEFLPALNAGPPREFVPATLINDLLAGFWAFHSQVLRSDVEIEGDLVILRVPLHFRLKDFLSLERKDGRFSSQDVHDIARGKILTQDLLRKPSTRVPRDLIPRTFVDDRCSGDRAERIRHSVMVLSG